MQRLDMIINGNFYIRINQTYLTFFLNYKSDAVIEDNT